jgi:IS1 family transposase/transposase-like protein
MECTRCESKTTVNNGKAKGKQRYKCKSCGFNFVEIDGRRGKNIDKQRMAIHLYLENMGFRAIGRVLGVSNVAVLKWIRAAGEWIESYHKKNKVNKSKAVEIIELDEMYHSRRLKKNRVWIWLALERGRGSILDFVTGSRKVSTGRKLWEKIKSITCRSFYATDHYLAYKQFIDTHKHKTSKAQTTRIESYNATVRRYLARFRRRTKCYSKSERLVELSLYLLVYKDLILSMY